MATENTTPAKAPRAKAETTAPKKASRTKEPAKDGAATKRTGKPKAPAEPQAKGPTKKEQIIEMLRSPDGTTIDAIVARFGVQRHSARAAVSVFGREVGGVSYDKASKTYRATAA